MTGTSSDGTDSDSSRRGRYHVLLPVLVILRFSIDSCATARLRVRLEVAGTVGWQEMI